MKTDLIKQFNLPPYVKGKSFSQASEAIQNKFKDRNDKYASDTKEELLSRLSQAQEYIKMQESLKNESQQVPDQMNGEIPEGMEQFMAQGEQPESQGLQQMAYGGAVNKYFTGGRPTVNPLQTQQMGVNAIPGAGVDPTIAGTSPLGVETGGGATPSAGAVVGAASTALELGKTAFGPSGIDTSGRTAAPDTQSRGMGVATGALKGASAGASFGPWGAAIGGVVGGAAGLLGAGKAKRDAQEAGQQFSLAQNAEYRQSDFAFGGPVKPTIDPTLKENITGFIEDRSRANTKIIEDSRLGAFPEVGSNITHPSNNRTYNVMFNDPNKDRSLVKDDKGGYSLQSNRNLQLNNKGQGWETGGEQPMTSAEAQYFMKNTRPNAMAMGGKVNKFVNGGEPDYAKDIEAFDIADAQARLDRDSLFLANDKFTQKALDKKANSMDGIERIPNPNSTINKTGKWLGENAGNIAQYAPIASNLLALKNLKKGTTDRGVRMDRTYQPQQFDEAQLINLINQDNTPAALRESSGGDLGALRQSLLAYDINKKKALSTGMAAGKEVERGENQFAYQAGAQKDQINAQLEGDYINRRAQDTGAYESTKSKLQRQIAEDAGAIGREEVDKKLVKEMFGYKWNGKYYIDKDGKVVPNNVVSAQVAEAKQKEATNASQYGGYLKK